MTTQPVSSSSSSSPYDVFLSFRGGDTRTNFTDHLYKALCDKGIYTFIDGELVRGEEISPALVKAIEESRISLIVFSENYASSRWCLDELVNILQCEESKQQIVLPIFYKVDPSDVRHQRSSYGDAFVHHERKFKDDKEKVLKWRRALKEAANLSGHTFKDGEYEATFINNIVDGIISLLLRRTYWNVAKHPVGIQFHVQDVKKLLDVGGNGRCMVGIWGTSGIGKTTIAKAIWNEIAHKFEGSCFLPNVREGSLVQLQETLLDKLLGKNLKIGNVDEGIGVITERMRHKKILLILDDVDQLEQLENLAGDGWFGEGSRVIITTKDRGLLDNREIELIYKVKKLYYNQALELLSWHAFGRSEPPEDYLELAQRAIAFAGGLPLALEILGSHLRNRGIRRWQVILDDYKGEPYTHIERILQKSYDALDVHAKEVFLDIACFFKGEKKNYVLQIVPQNCIEVLLDKAMITIEYWEDRIIMHDLLANLGKDIVHKESPNDPGQRSRLWFYKDVKRVLTENKAGTRNIKGIMVKFPEKAEITLNPECFRKMVNLQIFINRNASLCGQINYLPNALRWIDWKGYQLQSLPSEFDPVHLAMFNMPGGSIRRLEKLKNMPMLTSMNLSGCQFLEKIPDLSGIPNIKYLILSECKSLVEVDDSVGRLDKLVKLDLQGCVRLTRFATRLRLKSLETLYLSDCKRLESFPEIEVEMESLRILFMGGSGIGELPPSIAYFTGLRHLFLCGCFNLTRFATRLRLKSLESLDLRDCKRLESFPEIEVKMESLRYLNISRSGIRELPSSIAYLTGLDSLDAEYSKLQLYPNLSKFCLKGCSRIRKLERFKHLPKLRSLNLSGCQFLEKISDLSRISNIEKLYLSRCTNLVEIDDSIGLLDKVVTLELDGCTKLTRFATRHRLNSLKYLYLRGCRRLESIPELENMPKLVELNLDGCVNLTRFATRLRLNSLKRLSLSNCESLESFPEIEVEMESLKTLDISGSGISELPSSIAYLTGLQKLATSSSNFELPLLPNLYVLRLRGCNLSKSDFVLPLVCWYTFTILNLSGNNFVNLPTGFSKFVNLRHLDLSGCKSLLEVPEQVLPRRVESVWLHNCTSLEKIPEVSWVLLDNCTSLEKIPELPPDDGPSEDDSPEDVSMYLILTNCVRLRGYYDITANIFLNPRCSHIILPGDEVPKWFSRREDATLVKEETLVKWEYVSSCKVSIEIPPNLKWETLRLVLCVVAKHRSLAKYIR